MPVLGGDALGRLALGQLSQSQAPIYNGSPWMMPAKRAGLTAAVVATTIAGFVPAPTTAAPVFSSFSQPQPARHVLPAEQPVGIFEFAPTAIPFTGFMDFGLPRFARYSFADQQTSLLFEVEFVPPAQGGGTSRKLDFSEPVAEGPRRKKKTGLEPVKKQPTLPLIEPAKPALQLPSFARAPETPIDERSPFDLVDPALIPNDLLGLQAQMLAAQAAHMDEQDAQDIADIAAILDDLDEDET